MAVGWPFEAHVDAHERLCCGSCRWAQTRAGECQARDAWLRGWVFETGMGGDVGAAVCASGAAAGG